MQFLAMQEIFYVYEDKTLMKEGEICSYDDCLCRGTLDSLKLHSSFLYFSVSTKEASGALQAFTIP